MLLNVKARLVYTATQTCDALLQIEPTTDGGQRCNNPRLSLLSGSTLRLVEGEDSVGIRRWITISMRLECIYDAQIEVRRTARELNSLLETPRYQLPGAVIQYLIPSRYCQSDLFLDFTASRFGDLKGGALVQEMSDWIASNFTYDIFATDPGTTAADSFSRQRGVCRDYAHVLISLVRAMGIPARFVSAYAPGVQPQDFHALVEVFLEGDWYLVDPTGMATPADIVRVCVGRDASDASFLTSYAMLHLQEQSVEVERVMP